MRTHTPRGTSRPVHPTWLAALGLAAALALSACGGGGGGGGGGGAAPPSGGGPPPATGPTWTAGVFAAASSFKDQCQAPRSGVDIEGRPFPDQAGSELLEKFWLRSWTQETYLWNTEVTDRDPASVTGVIPYFDLLRTFALTPSGREKDQFHFTQSTADYLAQRNSAPRAAYGVRYDIRSSSAPIDIRILYTQPGAPAAAEVGGRAQFLRGDRILSVDGIDLITGPANQAEVDAINNALFPRTAGETHTFVLQPAAGGPNRTSILTSTSLVTTVVNATATLSTPSGPVGYALITTFSPFSSEREISQAITAFRGAGVRDLVVDLRYNGGGLLAVSSQLAYMVAGPGPTAGRAFERLRFNAAAGNRNPVTGELNQPTPFYSTAQGFSVPAGTRLDDLNLRRVFVLSTEDTCSASEAFINGLRGVNIEVILIGGRTCGKPFGFYPTDNCGTTFFTIQFQGDNDVNFGDYADGFVPANSSAPFGVRVPGCEVPDDLTRALGDPAEGMLAAALAFRETGSCPPPPPVRAFSVQRDDGAQSDRPPPLRIGRVPGGANPSENVLWNNRDMTMP